MAGIATEGWAPSSKAKLLDAIKECLKLGSKCEKGPNGPIGDWDVSGMTDLSYLFCGDKSHSRYVPGAETFNGDISKWDVGHATTMYAMFQGAEAFNRDISKWDVGRVEDMRWMFYNAKAFDQTLCGAWLSSTANQAQMFTGSRGKMGTAKMCRGAFALSVCVHACFPTGLYVGPCHRFKPITPHHDGRNRDGRLGPIE